MYNRLWNRWIVLQHYFSHYYQSNNCRSSTEFCRDILISSRSASPAPEHINNYNRDRIADAEEKIHTSRMRAM